MKTSRGRSRQVPARIFCLEKPWLSFQSWASSVFFLLPMSVIQLGY